MSTVDNTGERDKLLSAIKRMKKTPQVKVPEPALKSDFKELEQDVRVLEKKVGELEEKNSTITVLTPAPVESVGGGGPTSWGDITGTLSSQTDLQTALNGKSNVGHNHDGTYAAASHNHDASYSPLGHTHVIADVSGLQTALDSKAGSTHSHAMSDVTGLTAALNDKSDIGHGHNGLAPAGGTTGQVLKKINNTDYNYSWQDDLTGGGGGDHGTLTGLGDDDHTQYHTDARGDARYVQLAHAGSGGTAHSNATTSVAGFMSSGDKTKLDGVAAGATANSSDATLLNRANHTGTQTASTISDFNSAADARISAASINALADVVITSPSTGQVIKYNGTNWINDTDATGGGGGTPAGSTGDIQYNNAGVFAGAANVEISGDNLKLVSTTDPSAPTGGLIVYSKNVAGRHLPKIIGPAGIDTTLQVGLHGNSVFMVGPASGTTAPTVWGGTLTTAATMSSQQTIASANPWLATYRKRFQTSTTAGNASGMRTAYAQWFLGNAVGFGGFFFRAQVGANINLNGGQKFCGLCASTGALGGEPSALVNMIGMGWDAADSSAGNWFFMRNDGTGTATKVDLGSSAARANTTHGYDLIMYAPPGSASEIFVRIVNIHNNTTVLDTNYTTDLPAANTGLAFKCEVRNGATTSADNIECSKVYIESDY